MVSSQAMGPYGHVGGLDTFELATRRVCVPELSVQQGERHPPRHRLRLALDGGGDDRLELCETALFPAQRGQLGPEHLQRVFLVNGPTQSEGGLCAALGIGEAPAERRTRGAEMVGHLEEIRQAQLLGGASVRLNRGVERRSVSEQAERIYAEQMQRRDQAFVLDSVGQSFQLLQPCEVASAMSPGAPVCRTQH